MALIYSKIIYFHEHLLHFEIFKDPVRSLFHNVLFGLNLKSETTQTHMAVSSKTDTLPILNKNPLMVLISESKHLR